MIFDGVKSFELRKNDRKYQEGDTLLLREWNPENKCYTGSNCEVKVTIILEGFGLQEGYVCMGISGVIRGSRMPKITNPQTK